MPPKVFLLEGAGLVELTADGLMVYELVPSRFSPPDEGRRVTRASRVWYRLCCRNSTSATRRTPSPVGGNAGVWGWGPGNIPEAQVVRTLPYRA